MSTEPDPLCPVDPDRGPLMDFLGKPFYPFDPQPVDISIRDIARMLSRARRFSNQSDITVAQHCCIVMQLTAQSGGNYLSQLDALLHDAHEAYIGDFPRPLGKRMAFAVGDRFVRLDELKFLLDGAIYQALAPELVLFDGTVAHYQIGAADDIALLWEARDILKTRMPWAHQPLTDLPAKTLTPWRPTRARVEYLNSYHALRASL